MAKATGIVRLLICVVFFLALACTVLLYKNYSLLFQANRSASSKMPEQTEADQEFFDLLDEDSDRGENVDSSHDSDSRDAVENDGADNPWFKNELLEPSSKSLRAHKGESATDSKNWRIRVVGANGPTSYLRTIVFDLDKQRPYVGGKKHFSGMATLNSGHELIFHCFRQPVDPFGTSR